MTITSNGLGMVREGRKTRTGLDNVKRARTPLLCALVTALLIAGSSTLAWAADPGDPEASGQASTASTAGDSTWVSLQAALDDAFRPTLEDLPRVVTAIADLRYEVLLVFDREGRFIFYTEGNHHQVGIPRRQEAHLRGATLVHNHPGGSPPSSTDYTTLCSLGLRESIVAARVEGEVVQARIGLRGSGSHVAVDRCSKRGTSVLHVPWLQVRSQPRPTWVAEPRDRLAHFAYGILGAWL